MKYSLNQFYEVIGLSKQSVFQYLARQHAFNEKVLNLQVEVDELRMEHPGCGLEKMYYSLQPSFMGRDRFIEVFGQMGYKVAKVKNYIKTTKPVHCEYKNLIQGLLVRDINEVTQSDITYFLVGDRYYYIIFIIDVFSKRIVGSQASDHMRVQANLKAFKQVVKLRGKENLKDMIHHSDRGSQYVATKYRKLLKGTGVHISMGDSALENAYAERINGIIKNEYLKHWQISNLSGLRRCLRKAVNHYNNKRPHQHLPNRMAPVQFEESITTTDFTASHRELIYVKENTVKRKQVNTLIPQMEINHSQLCPLFY